MKAEDEIMTCRSCGLYLKYCPGWSYDPDNDDEPADSMVHSVGGTGPDLWDELDALEDRCLDDGD